MVKRMIKKAILSISLVLSIILSLTIVKAGIVDIKTLDYIDTNISYDLSSNYFLHKELEKPVTTKTGVDFLNEGYVLIASNSKYNLYVLKESLNIAVENKENGFIFYTDKNYYQWDLEAYYVANNLTEISSTIPSNGMYTTSIESNQKPKLLYIKESNGFKVEFDYDKLGIKYNLYVTLDGDKLTISVPMNEVEENGYTVTKKGFKVDANGNYIRDENGKLIQEEVSTTYNYLLKSLTFFEYFGSTYRLTDDTWMNGYTFIPDESGALIRYSDSTLYKTSYVKRVYSKDNGMINKSDMNSHIQDEGTLTLPIYGIVHGYKSGAFLTVIEDSMANAELHSNPYGYKNQNLETTYFKFYQRESYNIQLATSQSGSITSLSEEKYTGDIKYSYNFLYGEDASYNGFAKLYRENYLELSDRVDESKDVPLNLSVLAQDYKKGLFGKNFEEMTTYKEMLKILTELENSGVKNFNVQYMGMFRKGLYDNSNYRPRVSYNLGSRRDLLTLTNYIADNGYDLNVYLDPLTSYKESERGVTKKVNLSTYLNTHLSTSLKDTYLLNPDGFSKKITKYNKQYSKYNISDVSLLLVGSDLTSFRYKSKNYFRQDEMEMIINELEKLNDNGYGIGLYNANSYTFKYLKNYYDAPMESSSYTFITDSIPFVSMCLSGYSNLYTPYINYTDDYNKDTIRMIEYNIYPSFILTYEDSSLLRYTNSEYLYCSEYVRWKGLIEDIYNTIESPLKEVRGANITSYDYLSDGVTITKYSNGKSLIVNYSDSDYTYNSLTIKSKGYEVA